MDNSLLQTHLPLLPPSVFYRRLARNVLIGVSIILLSLAGGMIGYHYFENMSWIDAYVNAAMILSGMGPVSPLNTDAGKIFAGTYALFSGILFLVIMAIMFAPVVKLFLHKFHMQEGK
ncbi:MAG: ion channel [Parachlamydiaceae bacterium]